MRRDEVWTRDRMSGAAIVGEAARQAAIENEAAFAACDDILTGPAAWWPQRLRKTEGVQTAGMVRELLRRSPALVTRRPEDALQLASMTMALAEALDPADYPTGSVLRLRGQAMREHAWVLAYMQRVPEALEAVAKAERAFEHVPMAQFDRARLALVKASAIRMAGRYAEAAALARDAANVFLAVGDRSRYITARITEAGMLKEGGELEKALAIWQPLQDEQNLDPVLQVSIVHNIAVTLCDLGRRTEAIAPLEHCMAEWDRLGQPAEVTRSRWYLGNALMATDRQREAILLLRMAWHEFTELRLMVDGALTALDLADALIVTEQPDQVEMILRDVIAQLTNAGLAERAIPALMMLRARAAAGSASRSHVRETRAVVGRVAGEGMLFAQAPQGGA